MEKYALSDLCPSLLIAVIIGRVWCEFIVFHSVYGQDLYDQAFEPNVVLQPWRIDELRPVVDESIEKLEQWSECFARSIIFIELVKL